MHFIELRGKYATPLNYPYISMGYGAPGAELSG